MALQRNKLISIFIFSGIAVCICLLWKQISLPQMLPVIDFILIEKGKRQLGLYHKGQLIKTYTVALEFSPCGHKEQEGDGKTPEGCIPFQPKTLKASFI